MSDIDNNKNDKTSKAKTDVEIIETIEAEEVVLDADDEKPASEPSIEAIDAELDNLLPPVLVKSNSIGSLIVAAVLGGLISLIILFGIGYYLIVSSGLGGISKLLNDDDGINIIEERYTNISTRILALKNPMVQNPSSARTAPQTHWPINLLPCEQNLPKVW